MPDVKQVAPLDNPEAVDQDWNTTYITSVTQYRGPQFPREMPRQISEAAEAATPGQWVYRYETDDGRVTWVPVSVELVKDGMDAEGMILSTALDSLATLAKPGVAMPDPLPRSRFHRFYSELHRRLTGRVSEAEFRLRMAELAMVDDVVGRQAGGSDDYAT